MKLDKEIIKNFLKSLVQKEIQVKGKNGKTFTRKQWVSDNTDGLQKFNRKKIDAIHNYPEVKNSPLKDASVATLMANGFSKKFSVPYEDGDTDTVYTNHNGQLAIVRTNGKKSKTVIVEDKEYSSNNKAKESLNNLIKWCMNEEVVDNADNLSSDVRNELKNISYYINNPKEVADAIESTKHSIKSYKEDGYEWETTFYTKVLDVLEQIK